jgi:energy-coupling factor transport system ATP-binding protein
VTDSAVTLTDFSFRHISSERKISLNGSFQIKRNESVLIAGASGSGKSTLLHAIRGLIPDDIPGVLDGSIRIFGTDISACDGMPRSIGLVLQNPDAQIVCSTVKDELAFGLENLNLPPQEIETRIQDYSVRFGITALLNRSTATLSGGEKQKVALISILAMNPEILLLDEPTGYLDPESAQEFFQLLKSYFHSKTIITVEHNYRHIRAFCDRILYIDENGTAQTISEHDLDLTQTLPSFLCTGSGKTALEVCDLSFSYPEKKLFSDVSFSLSEGEAVSLSGRNGCGKSTLLKILSGLIKPQSGNVKIFGRSIHQIKRTDVWRQLSLLFQNPENHFFSLTVADEAEAALLEQFRLSAMADQSPFMLSEGEKRRLSLAAAMTPDRKIFLLDEPTFSLDAQARHDCAAEIYRMKKSGASFIIVSHDVPFCEAVCERRFRMEQGTLHRL